MDHAETAVMSAGKPPTPFLWTLAALILLAARQGPARAGVTAPDSATSAPEAGKETAPAAPSLLDGRYEAESPGWTGIRVAVKIDGGRLTSVEVLKAKGTPRYFERVIRRLPDLMEERGSAEVDRVTGATLSSNSLKEAVRSAMKKAESDASR
jgi:uncharacterized protein with FMN-binding domain